MSVTHPQTATLPTARRDLVSEHPQLMPFLVAVAMVAASVLVSLAVTGLPA